MIPTETRLSYAKGYLELGMLKEARKELGAIQAEDQERPDTLALRALVLLEQKRWKRLVALARQLAMAAPESPFGWVHWAYALRELGRHEEAKTVALRGLARHEELAVLWFNLACYCSLLGEVEDASNHLDKAISLDKQFEQEAVDDADLENLWNWLRGAGEASS